MIKSVEFPIEGNGYIYEKFEKPEKPDKTYYVYRSRPELYEAAMQDYKEEMNVYRKNKGKFVLPAAYNLIGKKFEFQDGKINVLFGPNASGKTTIIRAIAGNAMIDDGFTTFREPIEFGFMEKNYDVTLLIDKSKRNTSIVEWDGVPIYYDNFEETRRRSCGSFGDLVGSVLQNAGEEMLYHLTSSSISAGQNSLYLMDKILRLVEHPMSMKDLCFKQLKSRFQNKLSNDVWNECGQKQYDYFSQYECFEKETYPTLIFDELDKSLDIETVWYIYTVFFPTMVKKYGNQIILVSHSPLMLSDNIFNNEAYNIISMDDKYTNDVRKMLKNVTF